MATKMIRQTQFNTGEVDHQVWKRTDVNEYITAARSLLNCEVGTTGLVKKRKGTIALYNPTGNGAIFTSRMFEFIDNNGVYYLVLAVDQAFIIFTAPYTEKFIVQQDGYFVVTSRGGFVVAADDSLTYLTTIANDYQGVDISSLDYAQDNDAIIFSHPNYRPARLYVSKYADDGAPTFLWAPLDIFPRPCYDFNNINYNNFTVVLSVSADNILTFTFSQMGLTAATAFTDAWVDGQIVGGGKSVTEPVGYATITVVGPYDAGTNGGSQTFTASVQLGFETTNPATKGSQFSIKQPCWSGTSIDIYDLGYPSKVLFFQNRLWFANTKTLNNTVFGSKINAPINFDVGTGKDTDAIVYTIGQTQSGAIQWLNGGKQFEIYCQNSEFSCPQDQNAGITPSTFAVRQQSAFGASPDLKPQTYINDSYFASKTGKALVNYNFTGVGLSYKSTNISVASSHLVKAPSNRALLRGSDSSQDNFIYFLNPGDDTITAFQFATEYKLAALTPIEFGDNVQLIDICTINNIVYILKYYDLTGQFMIEHFNQGTYIDSQENAYMADNGVITGLSRFEGYTVQVVYSNQDYGKYLVSDGTITVENHSGEPLTVQVGLLYDVEIKPMYPFAGSAAAPFMKNLTRIYVDYYQSLNFYINGKLVPYQTFSDIQAGLPLTPKTDTAIFSPVSGWQRFDDEAVVITQSSPFDLQILGIGYQIDLAVI